MKTVGVSCSRPAWGAGPHKGSQVPCAGFFLWMFQKWGKAVHLQTQQLPHPGLPGALAASSHAFVTLALSILLLPANTPLSGLPESAASRRPGTVPVLSPCVLGVSYVGLPRPALPRSSITGPVPSLSTS